MPHWEAVVSVDGSISFSVEVYAESWDEAKAKVKAATVAKAENRGYQGVSRELVEVEQLYPAD